MRCAATGRPVAQDHAKELQGISSRFPELFAGEEAGTKRSKGGALIRLVRRGAPHPSPNTSPSRESRAYSAGLFFWTDASKRPRHPLGAVDMRAKNFGTGRRVFLPSATLGNPRVSPTAVVISTTDDVVLANDLEQAQGRVRGRHHADAHHVPTFV